MGQYANLTNLPTKGVDLSAVTQAASQSPLLSGARGSGNTLPSSGNPSTSLYNAGQVSQVGKTFADYGQKVGQVSIPGPGGQSSGGGQPQVAPGSYDPKSLSQDQRQQLWEFFGHKGIAPVGYGGESTPKNDPLVSGGNQITSFLPSFTPPPSPVSSATLTPKSASGATTMPTSLLTGGGVSGQAFQAPTLMANATKGLGNLSSIPSSVLGGILSNLQKFSSQPSFATQSFTDAGQPAGWVTAGSGTPKSVNQGDIERSQELGEMARDPLSGAIPGIAEKAGLSLLQRGAEIIPDVWKAAQPFIKKLPIVGAAGLGAQQLGRKESEGAYRNRQFGETTPEGDFKATPKGTTPATSKNILGNIAPKDAPQAIVAAIREPKKMDDVVAGIASEEVKPVIISMMQTATQQGDMDTAQKLLAIYNGVQKQINFNNMIQQAVTAISAGFGTPNAPGVTEARLPQVQQGVGQGLEGQPPSMPGFNQAQGQGVQQMPFRLPTVETQQQRPLLNPFMGA